MYSSDTCIVFPLIMSCNPFLPQMEYNRHQREVLCSQARHEMHVQQKMKELQSVDEEVMDWLRKYRQKKKVMSRKEREGVWKLLEKRTALCDQLQTWPRLPPR